MSRQPGNQGYSAGNRDTSFRQGGGQGYYQAPNRGKGSGGGDKGGGGGGGRDIKCYNVCNKLGHISRDCPEKHDQRSKNPPPSNTSNLQPQGYQYRGTPVQRGPGGGGGPHVFSQAVTSPQSSPQAPQHKGVEDALLANFLGVSRTSVDLPCRPNYGTQGQQVQIFANYFGINVADDLKLNCYDIKVTPTFNAKGDRLPDPKGRKLKQILKIMLSSSDFADLKGSIATDFQLRLISLHPLPANIQNQKVVYFHEADGSARNDAQIYFVHLAPANEFPVLKISDLMTYLGSTARSVDYPGKVSMVQALNILIGHHTNSSSTINMVGGRRAFSHNTETCDIGFGLNALRGYFSSVRLASARALVNVNLTHGAFYKEVYLAELMLERGGAYDVIEAFVRGLKVKTKYLKDKQGNQITRTRTISGFARTEDGSGQKHPSIVDVYAASPFHVWLYLEDSVELAKLTAGKWGRHDPESEGYAQRKRLTKERTPGPKYISVCEFFGEKYGIWSDKNEIFPVVNLGSRKDPVYVPAEACTVEKGQISKVKLSATQTIQMIGFAKLAPNVAAHKIMSSGLQTVGLIPASSQLTAFRVNVDNKMVNVYGRILSPPSIQYKGGPISVSNGKWNLQGRMLKTPPDKRLERWGYLAIRGCRAEKVGFVADERNLGPSLDALVDTLNAVGIETTALTTGGRGEMGRTIDIQSPKDKLLAKCIGEAAVKRLTILLVILPKKEANLYNTIKQLADVKSGVRTVCVVHDKFFGAKADYNANVALKFNLKLGGTNHTLAGPGNTTTATNQVAIISENKTMVVGIDVTHPGPGSANPSIAAMVASVDASLAQWPADLKVQIRTRQEMVTLLGDMLQSRLLLWRRKHHGVYPENILVYRDGVSESQYEQVLRDEFSLMQKACRDLYAETKQRKPRFTLVIVGKRHHTRFFAPPGSEARDTTSPNPKSGLVVDRGVTDARNWDFFLQSHSSQLGTARPSHYYVLWDEIFTDARSSSVQSETQPADMLEHVTNDMCYLFGRSTKAVSLCPPVYYADIACDRARRYIADKSYGSESGRSEDKMSEGEAEKLRAGIQKEIEVHKNLKETMFYI